MTHEVRRGPLEQLGYGPVQMDTFSNRARWKGWGSGKTVVVTGANAGLGFFASQALAHSGAHVIMACRNQARAERAIQAIQSTVPGASLEFMQFDSDSIISAMALAAELRSRPIDVLIANAGMIHTPSQRHDGVLGCEKVMSTNFVGHARLVGELADHFTSRRLRLVALGSMSTLLLPTQPQNLKLTHGYHAYRAYVQSKAALQAFAMGLDHRLRQLGTDSRSLAVHPGYCLSGLSPQVPGINEPTYFKRFIGQMQASFAQGKHHGAVALVEGALNPGLQKAGSGVYLGPQHTSKGRISLASPAKITRSKVLQDPVWELFIEANDGVDPFALS